MAEKHYTAIGAEWCGYSKKQEEVVEKVSGFPTWFEKEGPIDGDAPVTPIEKEVTNTQGLHFMQVTQLLGVNKVI